MFVFTISDAKAINYSLFGHTTLTSMCMNYMYMYHTYILNHREPEKIRDSNPGPSVHVYIYMCMYEVRIMNMPSHPTICGLSQ